MWLAQNFFPEIPKIIFVFVLLQIEQVNLKFQMVNIGYGYPKPII